MTARRTYSYLGPAGTFTEAALDQVAEARGQDWRPVHNVGEALADVLEGRSDAAMIAIENSIEGGVSTTQDALNFVLVAPRGTTLDQVEVIAAHPVAYAQCHGWLGEHLPTHSHVPAASNVASAIGVLDGSSPAPAPIAAPGIAQHYPVDAPADGRYRFVIDADGHIEQERMADALLGIRRFSPRVVFLGSCPRADRQIVQYPDRYSDEVFIEARDWLRGILSGEPEA